MSEWVTTPTKTRSFHLHRQSTPRTKPWLREGTSASNWTHSCLSSADILEAGDGLSGTTRPLESGGNTLRRHNILKKHPKEKKKEEEVTSGNKTNKSAFTNLFHGSITESIANFGSKYRRPSVQKSNISKPLLSVSPPLPMQSPSPPSFSPPYESQLSWPGPPNINQPGGSRFVENILMSPPPRTTSKNVVIQKSNGKSLSENEYSQPHSRPSRPSSPEATSSHYRDSPTLRASLPISDVPQLDSIALPGPLSAELGGLRNKGSRNGVIFGEGSVYPYIPHSFI